MRFLTLLLLGFVTSPYLQAGEVEVVDVRINCQKQQCQFDVTLRHQDEGWDHYADRWEIRNSDDRVLATRVLYHPHINEQPFTRSLSGVVIPDNVSQLYVIGHDKVHGYSNKRKVLLPITTQD